MSTFLEDELQWLDGIGPRLTGSHTHNQLINRVQDQLEEIGLTVETDTYTFDKWEADADPDKVHFSIEGDSIPLSAVFPYSGHTRGERLQADLVTIRGPVHFWGPAKGKIAVVPVDNSAIDVGCIVHTWFGGPRWPRQHQPTVTGSLAAMDLHRAATAGVLGVVFAWKETPSEEANQQYTPFTLPYQDIPAVFVAGEAAERSLTAAASGATARFQLTASLIKEHQTRTIWASIPGKQIPEETIICVTHSDGMNSVEENGHIALVSLAKDLAISQPKRTIVFALITGHLRIPAFASHGQATSRWLDDHPEIWKGGPGQKRAVFGLGLEHFGAREFSARTSSTSALVPTGRNEPELLYATTEQAAQFCKEHWNVESPEETRISRPSALFHFGEAEPMMQKGIPTVALVTLPIYLLSLKQDDYVDQKLMARQIDGFARILKHADGTSSHGFGKVELPSFFAKGWIIASFFYSYMLS